MHLADGTTVDTGLAMIVIPAIYDSVGLLVPVMLAVIFYILEALTSFCILGVPFLSACNPVTNWSRCTVTFGSSLVLCLPQQPAAAVEVVLLVCL